MESTRNEQESESRDSNTSRAKSCKVIAPQLKIGDALHIDAEELSIQVDSEAPGSRANSIYMASISRDGVTHQRSIVKVPKAIRLRSELLDGSQLLDGIRESCAELKRELTMFKTILEGSRARSTDHFFPRWGYFGTFRRKLPGDQAFISIENDAVFEEEFDWPFVVFEHIDGGIRLDQWLMQHRPTGAEVFPVVNTIFKQILCAVDSIHRVTCVHGDLHPGNILVVGDPGSAHVRLIDFGLSSDLRHNFWLRSEPGGAGSYIAPEILNEEPADQRSDIFSAGCILFEIITGTKFNVSHHAKEISQVVQTSQMSPALAHRKVLLETLRRLSHQVALEYPQIVDLLQRSLSIDPANRTPTIDAVLHDLSLCDPSERLSLGDDGNEGRDRINCLIENIKSSASTINSSVLRRFASRHIEHLVDVILQIKNQHIVLQGDGEMLRRHMCELLTYLGPGSSYQTVSMQSFWSDENLEVHGRYLSLNRFIASLGVKIGRVLVLRSSELNSKSSTLAKKILSAHQFAHMEWLGMCNSLHARNSPKPISQANYVTKAKCVSDDDYDHLMSNHHNFALWRNGKETLKIVPNYINDRIDKIFISIEDRPNEVENIFKQHFSEAKSIDYFTY